MGEKPGEEDEMKGRFTPAGSIDSPAAAPRKFQTLSNASREVASDDPDAAAGAPDTAEPGATARHDAAMNSIRNLKG